MDAGDLGIDSNPAPPHPARWLDRFPERLAGPAHVSASETAAPPLEMVRLEKRAGSPCLASWPWD